MNTYVVELFHGPSMSPLANAAVRAHAKKVSAALPKIMEEKGIKLVGDYHLDPEHRLILIYEAPNVEAVRDMLYESGFMHYNEGRIYPASSLAEVRERGFHQLPIV